MLSCAGSRAAIHSPPPLEAKPASPFRVSLAFPDAGSPAVRAVRESDWGSLAGSLALLFLPGPEAGPRPVRLQLWVCVCDASKLPPTHQQVGGGSRAQNRDTLFPSLGSLVPSSR